MQGASLSWQHALHALCCCMVQRVLQGGPSLQGGPRCTRWHPKALLVRLPGARRDRRQSRLLHVIVLLPQLTGFGCELQ